MHVPSSDQLEFIDPKESFVSKLLEGAKALVAPVVTAVGGVATVVQATVADDAISLDEAKGVWLAVTAAVTTIAAAYGVWRTRNAPPT